MGRGMRAERKAVWGWALYDWANSAFATTVMAGFFPIYFKQYWSAGLDSNLSTAQLGLANSTASLVVALMAPLLGAIADKGSIKKKFLTFFAYLGVAMTAGLFFVGRGQWTWAAGVYVMGVIGWSGANIFYDALLPAIADERHIDVVSSLGFSLGYLGGGLLFLINVCMTLWPHIFGLADAGQAVRWAFVSVAVWWGGFAVFAIRWVPEAPLAVATNPVRLAAAGFVQFIDTLRKIRKMRTILLFLLAYWLYIDGVDTIIRMAVDYGLSLGFAANDLIVALLITQFVGFPAALFFGKLGQRWGVRRAIFLAIGCYMFITAWGCMMTSKNEFYLLAIFVGLVQGGIQALSRSYYTRLIPQNKSAEFFGFYNMLGKFAVIIGPTLMGGAGLLARRLLTPPVPSAEQIRIASHLASRWSIASVLILFAAGAIIFYHVDEAQGRKEAGQLA
jgi:UMF1 family MFS transporter